MGYNGFPRKVNDTISARHERPLKYQFFEHAERNAIYNATLYGSSLRNCVLYVTMPPCTDCARGIIQSGIKEVIFFAPSEDEKSKLAGWRENIKYSLEMFDETGIKYKAINTNLEKQQKANFSDVLNIFDQIKMDRLSDNLIVKNGLPYQISVCIEEITELASEMILKNSFENMSDETADMFITKNHVVYGYNIKNLVDFARDSKLHNPKFMETDDERIIAFLNLQKALLKNMNRKTDNISDIVNRIADAEVAILKSIIDNNNLSHVRNLIDIKIERTIKREFIDKGIKYESFRQNHR